MAGSTAASVLSLAIYFRQVQSAERGGRNMIGTGALDPDAVPLARDSGAATG
jgi:hypothetical protein